MSIFHGPGAQLAHPHNQISYTFLLYGICCFYSDSSYDFITWNSFLKGLFLGQICLQNYFPRKFLKCFIQALSLPWSHHQNSKLLWLIFKVNLNAWGLILRDCHKEHRPKSNLIKFWHFVVFVLKDVDFHSCWFYVSRFELNTLL